MKSLKYLIPVLCLSFISAASAEQFLCVVDHSTGFSFDKNTEQWKPTVFAGEDKYIISKPTDDDGKLKEKFQYVVREIGTPNPIAYCETGFSGGYLFCEGMATKFSFNKENGRFLTAYMAGYYHDALPGQEGRNTPYMQIGKCSPF